MAIVLQIPSRVHELTDGSDLVNEILDGQDAVLAKVLLDDGVAVERDALAVDLAVTALVDELADRLQVRLACRRSDRVSSPSLCSITYSSRTVGNVRLDAQEELSGGLRDLDEDTCV